MTQNLPPPFPGDLPLWCVWLGGEGGKSSRAEWEQGRRQHTTCCCCWGRLCVLPVCGAGGKPDLYVAWVWGAREQQFSCKLLSWTKPQSVVGWFRWAGTSLGLGCCIRCHFDSDCTSFTHSNSSSISYSSTLMLIGSLNACRRHTAKPPKWANQAADDRKPVASQVDSNQQQQQRR